MRYTLSYESNPIQDDVEVLGKGIMEYDKKKKEMKQLDFFAFFLRDENDQIIGGCNGDDMYGCLFIAQLWVAENLRGKGRGTQLMEAAEKLAKKSGCHFIAVNAMDWHPIGFYKKLGFYVEFERRGFDKDSIFYFLRKDLK